MGFAAAAGHRLTTEAAAEVLDAGGTAVDACLAAAAMAFVVEPVLGQPLGGGHLMLTPNNGKPRICDAFVQTPRRTGREADLDLKTITVDFGKAKQDFHIGAGTIAVPCLMQGLLEAHDRFGRMALPELFSPALRAAREGVTQSAFQAHASGLIHLILTDTPEAEAVFAPGGKVPEAGSTVSNPQMADVLEVLALEGVRFFSEGEIAAALLDLPGSHLQAEDLRRAHPIWRSPLMIERSGAEVALNPAPSLGGVQIALGLSILPRCPGPATVAAALKQVAAARRRLAIDDTPELADTLLLDPDLVAELQAIVANHRPAIRGTTHISATDRDGNGAALTLTNGEGCGRMLPGTGIMPNNMLGEEDLVPNGPTSWQADTRLASMMCPTAVRAVDGTLTMLGSGGSARIRSALTTTLLALIDEGLPPDIAVTQPRLHVGAGQLDFEDTGDEARRVALLADWPEAGVWDQPNMYFGGVHIARCAHDGSGAAAAGDPRRQGDARTG